METKIQFTQTVVSMVQSLRPFAINLTRDSEDANDLLQETAYRAITNEDKFHEGTNLKAWLFTIMRNIFINNYRRNAKRKTLIDTTDNLFFINSSSILVENTATSKIVMDEAKKAINELTPEFRIPFMMHYEGFKYHEIAEELNLPLGTVKSRIFFARKELKDKLKAYGK